MSKRRIQFVLNGRSVSAEVEPHHNLIELLQQFDLRGARESCGQGLCGCCTVAVDDTMVSGCLYFAIRAEGKAIRTVEHFDADGALSPLQQAFIEKGAFQCGFCTSGFIMMGDDLLRSNPRPSDEQIRDHLCGNLCRCAAYPEIVEAIKDAAARA
jgi:carbon-monoxide dehydrogenase small subunit